MCTALFLASFAAAFFLLFQKHIRYIREMEENVSALCSKNFSQQIPIHGNTELSTLAANINNLGCTVQLFLLTEDAKLKQKEQFVKSIAHDIRTPLTVVNGYLELLAKGYAENEENAQLFIGRALERINHIRRLTDDLFDFEESCRTLPLDTCDGQELLRQMVSNISSFLRSNHFRLKYISRVTRPFRMQANITLLLRLIDNICANILKHGAAESTVILTASLEEEYLVLEETNEAFRRPVKAANTDSGTSDNAKHNASRIAVSFDLCILFSIFSHSSLIIRYIGTVYNRIFPQKTSRLFSGGAHSVSTSGQR